MSILAREIRRGKGNSRVSSIETYTGLGSERWTRPIDCSTAASSSWKQTCTFSPIGRDIQGRHFAMGGPRILVTPTGNLDQTLMAKRYRGFWGLSSGGAAPSGNQ
jgi:hypothetical protein